MGSSERSAAALSTGRPLTGAARRAPLEDVRGSALGVLAAAVLSWAAPAFAQAKPCVVRGVADMADLQVAPADGVAPFAVSVYASLLEVTASPAGASVPVRVEGTLDFEGLAPPASIPWSIARPVAAADGVVSLASDSRLLAVHAAGAGVVADVEVPGGKLAGLPLPCDALTVKTRNGSSWPVRYEATKEGDGTFWTPKDGTLTLSSGAGTGAQVRVVLPSPDPADAGAGDGGTASTPSERIAFVRLATQGAWTRITTPDAGPTQITGWVPSASLRPVPSVPQFGWSSGGGSWCGGPSRRGDDLYVGDAFLPASTPVYAQPGSGRWGTLRSAVGVTVDWRRGEAWVAVLAAPGMACIGDGKVVRAWVERSAIRLPEGA
jgi:hypothetical protein